MLRGATVHVSVRCFQITHYWSVHCRTISVHKRVQHFMSSLPLWIFLITWMPSDLSLPTYFIHALPSTTEASWKRQNKWGQNNPFFESVLMLSTSDINFIFFTTLGGLSRRIRCLSASKDLSGGPSANLNEEPRVCIAFKVSHVISRWVDFEPSPN